MSDRLAAPTRQNIIAGPKTFIVDRLDGRLSSVSIRQSHALRGLVPISVDRSLS